MGINTFTQELNDLRIDHFNTFSNQGHFLSKKFFFIFGIDITMEKKKDTQKHLRYIDIKNKSELDSFIKELNIHKEDSFRKRIDNITKVFPIYFELDIFKNINDLKFPQKNSK